jgi:hypothetical protein
MTWTQKDGMPLSRRAAGCGQSNQFQPAGGGKAAITGDFFSFGR